MSKRFLATTQANQLDHPELMLGLLNLTDQDYRLNPLTVYAELPRERTFMVRLNFQF